MATRQVRSCDRCKREIESGEPRFAIQLRVRGGSDETVSAQFREALEETIYDWCRECGQGPAGRGLVTYLTTDKTAALVEELK